MPVDPTEHYKLILQQHNHAADFRLKILYGWGLSYAGLVITFNWVYEKAREFSWIVPAVGIAITWLIWYFDVGNRHGIISWRKIGRVFEEKNHVPKSQSYFRELTPDGLGFSIDTATFGIDKRGSLLSPRVDHGNLIDTTSVVIISLLAALTINLVWTCGAFLGKQDYPTLEVSAKVSKVIVTLLVWGSVWLCWKKWSSIQLKTEKAWKWFFYVIGISPVVGWVYFLWVIGSFPLAQSVLVSSVGGVIVLLNLILAIWLYVNRPRYVDKLTLHRMIEERAYFIWENKGKQSGKDMENWLEAEENIKASVLCTFV